MLIGRRVWADARGGVKAEPTDSMNPILKTSDTTLLRIMGPFRAGRRAFPERPPLGKSRLSVTARSCPGLVARRAQAPAHCVGIVKIGVPSLLSVSTNVNKNMRDENTIFEGISRSSIENQ